MHTQVQQSISTLHTIEQPSLDIFQHSSSRDSAASDDGSEAGQILSDKDIADALGTAQPGSLSPTESSKDYLDLMKHMVEVLGVNSANEPAEITDIVHRILQTELPPATLLPMLPIHTKDLKEA